MDKTRSQGEKQLAEAEPRQLESDGQGKSFSKSLQVDWHLLLAEAAVDQCDSYLGMLQDSFLVTSSYRESRTFCLLLLAC